MSWAWTSPAIVIMILAASLLPGTSFAERPEEPEIRRKLTEMMEQNRKAFPGLLEMSVETLRQGLEDKTVILIDVRPEKERAVSVIPGSMTATEFEKNLSRNQGKEAVCYCTVGYRSAMYAQKMNRRGIPMKNFNGSILAWCQAHQKVETPDGQATNKVHVYAPKWNLLPPEYKGVW